MEQEPVSIKVVVDPGPDYQVGNFLNGLDQLFCWYRHQTQISNVQMRDAMRLYAAHIED